MAASSLAPLHSKTPRSSKPTVTKARSAAPRGVQPKLKIGQPTDASEREADRIADLVLSMDPRTARHFARPHIAAASPSSSTHSASTHGTDAREAVPSVTVHPVIGRSPTTQAHEVTNPAVPVHSRGEASSVPNTSTPQPSASRDDPTSPRQRPSLPNTRLVHPNVAARPEANAVQRACSACSRDEEIRPKRVDGFIHQDAPSPTLGAHASPPSFEAQLDALRRMGGQPLSTAARSFFEPRFSADFSAVRVYTGPTANRLASSIGARAFTHGNDIVFADGQYSTNPQGLSLMAHELTHTLQQRPARDEQGPTPLTRDEPTVRRACAPQPSTNTFGSFPPSCGIRETSHRRVRFDALKLPDFKSSSSSYAEVRNQYSDSHFATLIRAANYTREDTSIGLSPQQDTIWTTVKNGSRADRMRNRALDIRATAYGLRTSERTERLNRGFFYLNPADDSITWGAATFEGAQTEMVRPRWSPGPNPVTKDYQIDHIVELQIANWTRNPHAGSNTRAKSLQNLWLLEQGVNNSSGTNIQNEIERRAQDHADASSLKDNPPKTAATLLHDYAMHFDGHTGGLVSRVPGPGDAWEKSQIWNGDQLEAVGASDWSRSEGHRPFNIRVYRTVNKNSTPKEFAWRYTPGGPTTLATTPEERTWESVLGTELRISSMTLTVGPEAENLATLGSIEVNIPGTDPDWEPFPAPRQINIVRTPDAVYAGYIKDEGQYSLQSTKNARKYKRCSPTEVTEFNQTDTGYSLKGNIIADTPLIHDAGASPGQPLHIAFTEAADEHSSARTDQMRIDDAHLNESNLALPEGLRPTHVDIGIREGRSGHLEIYGRLQANIENLGNLDATASLGARGLELSGHFVGTGVFHGLNANATYTQYSDDSRTAPGGLNIEGTYNIPVGTVPYLEAGTVRLAINDDSVSFDGTLRVQETAWLEPGAEVRFEFARGFVTIGGSARLRTSLLPPGITAAQLEFDGMFVDNGLDLQARASASFDPAAIGFPVEHLDSANVEAIWKNGEITIGGSVRITTDLADAAMQSGASPPDPAADTTPSFRLEDATLALYVTSRRLDSDPTFGEVVPALGEPMDRHSTAPTPRGTESTELAWWGHGEVSLKYGDQWGGGLRIDVSPNNLWTLSGEVTFGTLTTLMDQEPLVDVPWEEVDLARATLAEIPIEGPFRIGISAHATVRYGAQISVGPVTVDQARLQVSGTLGIPDSLQIRGSAGLALHASGRAGISMSTGAGVSLNFIGLNLLGVEGSITGSLEATADARASANVSAAWSPSTGLCIADIGPDFGLDIRLEGRISAEVDVRVAWFSILRRDITLREISVDGPRLSDIFGSSRLEGPATAPRSGGPCVGESLSADQFSTGIRDRFANRNEVESYVDSIVRFLGGSDGALKPGLDEQIDRSRLPQPGTRGWRLAQVIQSGRADRLARRYGLQPGGTLAFDIFQEHAGVADFGQERQGMLLGVDEDRHLVVADLRVFVWDPAVYGPSEHFGLPAYADDIAARYYPDLLARDLSPAWIRVLDISTFYDQNGQPSSFTPANWHVGDVRTMNPNSLDDSPLTRPPAGRPYDCPSCHDRITRPPRPPDPFGADRYRMDSPLFNRPMNPPLLEPFFDQSPPDPLLADPARVPPRGADDGSGTCTNCHTPSRPTAVEPRFDFSRLPDPTSSTGGLSDQQLRELAGWMDELNPSGSARP